MVICSQHIEQIMENQTRFDLNAALEGWRNELAAQPNLTTDARCELEVHLRDTVSELQRRGFSDEEAFWLARRRTGQPQQFSAEFVKADPGKIWQERIFWLAIALLLIEYWDSFTLFILMTFHPIAGGDLNSILFHNIIFDGPIIWVAYSLVFGQTRRIKSLGDFLLRSRRSFISITMMVAILVSAFCCLPLYFQMSRISYQFPEIHHRLVVSQLEQLLIPRLVNSCLLIAVIAWLMPRNRKTPKPDLSLSR